MKNVSVAFLAILSVLCSSCSLDHKFEAEFPEQLIKNAVLQPNAVDLYNPKLGQKTYYERFRIKCNAENLNIKMERDTLILEVVSGEEHFDLLLKESLTDYSESNDGWGPIYYPLYKEEGAINIPERMESALFHFYDNDRMILAPLNIGEVPVHQDTCAIYYTKSGELFEGFDIGYLETFHVDSLFRPEEASGAHRYTGSFQIENKAVVSCRPYTYPGPAYLIYDNHQLNMSFSITYHVDLNSDIVVAYGGGWLLMKN